MIPPAVALFLKRGLLFFILWKALYLLVLQPGRILDDPLTRAVAWATTASLNTFSPGHHYSRADGTEHVQEEGGTVIYQEVRIFHDGQDTLNIWDACNALEVMILYAGFIVCFPAPTKRKLIYIAGGTALIFLLNIIRCSILVLIALYHRSYLDFSHHFAFTILVYSLVFFLWYRFSKKTPSHVRTV